MNEDQYIETDGSETKYYSDRGMTVLHRKDGPAAEYANGTKEWYLNGKLHREGGPALEHTNGDNAWYINGKRHRCDGPAVEWTNGDNAWYINGARHREDGPAIEYMNGDNAWYINNTYLTEEEFNTRMSPILELTFDEIAEKFGVSVDKLKIKA
jgi:hypothetical protein